MSKPRNGRVCSEAELRAFLHRDDRAHGRAKDAKSQCAQAARVILATQAIPETDQGVLDCAAEFVGLLWGDFLRNCPAHVRWEFIDMLERALREELGRGYGR